MERSNILIKFKGDFRFVRSLIGHVCVNKKGANETILQLFLLFRHTITKNIKHRQENVLYVWKNSHMSLYIMNIMRCIKDVINYNEKFII